METTNDGGAAAVVAAAADGADRDQALLAKDVAEQRLGCPKPLPERVCELFLMQNYQGSGGPSSSRPADPFFRSPFLWERLPQMLFSNGANGLGAAESDGGGRGGVAVVRDIPIRVVSGATTIAQSQPRQSVGGGGSQQKMMASSNAQKQQQQQMPPENGTAGMAAAERRHRTGQFPSSSPPAADRFSLMYSPELRRHFDSLFWTPQQARRIAEKEQQREGERGENGSSGFMSDSEELAGGPGRPLNRGGPIGGSSVTVYSIPISDTREEAFGPAHRSNQQQREAEERHNNHQQTSPGGHYSAIPFRRRTGMNSALSTPSLFHGKTLSPTRDKPPLPPSNMANNNSSRAKPPPPTSFPASQSQPALRRTQTTFTLPPQELPRRDSEPNLGLTEEQQRGLIGGMSSQNNHHQQQQHQQQQLHQQHQQQQQSAAGWLSAKSRPSPNGGGALLSSEDGSSLSGASVCSSSPQSADSNRSKSPSLASLRQSLLRLRPLSKGASASSLVPACVRGRQSSGSDQEETEEDAATLKRPVNRKGEAVQNGGGNNSSSLTASSLHLTQFAPGHQAETKTRRVDAVEEAIRSLEQFNPSEFVQHQYHHRQQQQPSSAMPKTTINGGGGPRPAPPFGRGAPPKVFLARAEPVPVRQPLSASSSSSISSGSASSLPSAERRSSLLSFSSANSENASPPSSLLFHQQQQRRPSTLSSGSATPTQISAPEQQQPFFSQSLDSNRTPRAQSPAATENGGGLPEMDQLINRLKGQQQQRRGVTFSDQPITQHFYAPFDGPPPDYSESGSGDEEEAGGSVADSEEAATDERNAAALEAEAQLRKRFLCSQLTDCAKVVEINALKMGQFVAAGAGLGGWRQPHILRHNLGAIRDTIYTVEFALDELVESLGRVSLDGRDPRRTHLRQLAQPVQTSLAMLRRLRSSLDSTGWSLTAMARPRVATGSAAGQQDALDQVVAILPQLPKDCSKLVQWIYSLSVWPDPRAGRPAATFLPASAAPVFRPTLQPPPPPAPLPFSHQNGGSHFGQARPPSPTSSLQNYYSSGEEESNAKEKSNGHAKVAGPAEVMDGGESTSSTSSAHTLEQEGPTNGRQQQQHQQQPPATPKDIGDCLVLEEDDLASVISESPWPPPSSDLHSPPSGASSASFHRRVNAELARSLTPDQRELFRLYEPQMGAHIAAICSLIEEFFSLVEAHREPKLSFQKIQMLYIEGHSLVGIARVLCRDDSIAQHRPLSAFLAHECAKLDQLLNECLAAAKVAKTKAQNSQWDQTVPAVQSMCQAVVAVSECANQLRAFWKNCAGTEN